MRDWKHIYRKRGALWIHDGNPKRPHALLSSGKHSGGFFNSEDVMDDPKLLDEAAVDLIQLLEDAELDLNMVDLVAGPAMGAITLAHDLARNIWDYRSSDAPCRRAYAEKVPGDTKAFAFNRTRIGTERVLVCEDVTTTAGSVELVIQAVEKCGAVTLPYVAVLVNRSGLKDIGGRKIVALIDEHLPSWTPEECPLCRKGSEAIPAKKPVENWELLNAKY